MKEAFQLIISIVVIVANVFIYRKMGYEGWEAIIPFYNIYILCRELWGNGWKCLLFLIPFYNIYLLFKFYIDLAHSFNQSTGFGLGLVFLSPIFACILAFSPDIEYCG